MAQGFVYILVSPNSNYVKIGGTERPISERLRDINGSPPYSDHGPWELSDFLYVTDWRLVEGQMHDHFRSNAVRDVTGTRELFSVPPHEARTRLRSTNSLLRIDHERTEQIFSNREVKLFLFRLFELSGLFGNVDIQGAWTLTLLPKTNGGRWFTLNIGSHEVAFSTKRAGDTIVRHFIVLDRLILEYPDTIIWIGNREGSVDLAEYVAAERAVVINFNESFANAERFFCSSRRPARLGRLLGRGVG
jgi:T5orf172 domain-containing protein